MCLPQSPHVLICCSSYHVCLHSSILTLPPYFAVWSCDQFLDIGFAITSWKEVIAKLFFQKWECSCSQYEMAYIHICTQALNSLVHSTPVHFTLNHKMNSSPHMVLTRLHFQMSFQNVWGTNIWKERDSSLTEVILFIPAKNTSSIRFI